MTKWMKNKKKLLKVKRGYDAVSAHTKKEHAITSYLILAIIIIVSIILSFIFYYGITPISGSDNYIYSSSAYSFLTGGFKSLTGYGILSVKYVMILGESMFIALLGPSSFSYVLFDVLCLIGTIASIYVIGGVLYNRRTGLIAAGLYSFFPLAVTMASMGGDDVPMTFFATIAVMFVVLGLKRKQYKRLFFLFSGFAAIFGLLVVSEEVIILLLIMPIMLWYLLTKRNKSALFDSFALVIGIICGIAIIMLLGYLASGNLLYVYNITHSWDVTTYCASPNPSLACTFSNTTYFQQYIGMIFPYRIIQNLRFLELGNWTGAKEFFTNITYPSQYFDATYNFGHYFYFLILSVIIILLARNKKRIVLPAAWLLIVLIYLSFGTMNVTSYVKVSPIFQRFLLLLMPAAVLLIALGFETLMEYGEQRKGSAIKIVLYSIVAIMLFALFFESIFFIRYIDYSWYNNIYPAVQVGKFIIGINQSAPLYVQITVPLDQYSNFRPEANMVNADQCQSLPNGSYIVMLENNTMQSACNLSVVFSPPQKPLWLERYTMYETQFLNFPLIRVYRKD